MYMCMGYRWDKWDKWELLQIVGELGDFSSILLSQRWENGNLRQNVRESPETKRVLMISYATWLGKIIIK